MNPFNCKIRWYARLQPQSLKLVLAQLIFEIIVRIIYVFVDMVFTIGPRDKDMCMSSLCLTSKFADTLEYVKRLIELKINLDSCICKLFCVVPINHAAKQVLCQLKNWRFSSAIATLSKFVLADHSDSGSGWSIKIFFLNVGPPKESIFFDHLLWSIFQS